MAAGKTLIILAMHFLLNSNFQALCNKIPVLNYSEKVSYREHNQEVSITKDNDLMPNSSNCSLHINEETKYFFTKEVLKNKYDFVHFELQFNKFEIKESDDVIAYKRWVWTFKGENGGYQKLFQPLYSGYLSFGLLWTHTFIGPKKVKLFYDGTCNNLTSGNYTDKLIGAAFAEMTEDIAYQDDIYNSSYWCHHVRIKLTGPIRYVCRNIATCPYQTIEYRCCKYKINFVTKQRTIECNHEDYYLGSVWWQLSIYLDELVLAYFPLLLVCVYYKIKNATKFRHVDVEMVHVLEGSNELITKEFVYLNKDNYPITFLGTLKHAVCICNNENVIVSRILRSLIIILPLSVLVIQISLAKIYEDHLFKEAISKGAFLSFYTFLLDFQTAKQHFLVSFGGPHIAIAIFVFFSCLYIHLPKDFESFLARGLFEFKHLGISPLTLSLKTKCRLAGLRCNDLNGFKRVNYTLLSNLLLLLNIKFWSQTVKIILYRWNLIIYPFLRKTDSLCLLAVIFIPSFILYGLICTAELTVTLLLYLFPIINFFFILLKAYIVNIINFCRHHSNICVKQLHYILIPFTILTLPFTWYMYSLVFFQCLVFYTDIILYTYSGIIAYPRISYGYLILVLMTIFYTVEILNKFGKSYHTLLRTAIKESIKVNFFSQGYKKVEIPDDKGIPKQLWELIVERHQARRIKMMSTVLHLLFLISVLYVSVDLLERFNKFQELSVLTHVFTVLVICALPKIIRSLYIDRLCSHNKHQMKREIHSTILDFLAGTTEDHVLVYRLTSQNEYEQIS